jgi:hypothetical protein
MAPRRGGRANAGTTVTQKSWPLWRLTRIAILVQSLLFAYFVAASHDAFVHLSPPTTTDFSSFYAAGVLAGRGEAAAAYDPAKHGAVEEKITSPGIKYHDFLNPPPFLLICAPLAKLPYLLAFVVFEVLTLAFWLGVAGRIAGGGRQVMLVLLAMPSVYWALGWGQNSFLTAGLMGLGTLLLRTRPGLAGAAFGALAIKPHFGVLIPLVLLCGRQWRAVLAAGLTFLALCALSEAIFGIEAWRGFVHALGNSGQVALAGHIDPGGAARLLGASQPVAWGIQGLASLAAACAVGWVWIIGRGNAPGRYEVRMAALVSGTLIAMPFLLFYDLLMASVAAAWLAAAARRTAWLPGEAATLAMMFGLVLLDFPSANLLHLAIGCLVGPVLLALAVRRTRLF